MKSKRFVAVALAWTAVLHTVVGIFLYRGQLADMARDGLFNSVDSGGRSSAFWFFLFGAMIWTLSRVVGWLANNGQRVPLFLGAHLLAVGLIGVFFAPLSGFWLVIPQAIVLLRR
ncbi:DUF6463 family protein [Paenibacillus flagellatus]|uniref:DUF4064 domain-containing protein n=1 Tax=Paenibacillus flagellatus TaxID=2211139 RepID=A0A2V5K2K8_9BACL|nr:DUF6463 family protein [Paenibacillus flagellatus]PYI53469.1 hypothetical protein DLM86_16990 [Paenibacillus flagellatus]